MTIIEISYLSGKGQNLSLALEYKADHQHLGLNQHQSQTDNQYPGLVQHQDDDQLQGRDQEFQHKDHFHQRAKEQEVKYQHQGDQDRNLLHARELNLPSLQEQNHFQDNVHQSIDFSYLSFLQYVVFFFFLSTLCLVAGGMQFMFLLLQLMQRSR